MSRRPTRVIRQALLCAAVMLAVGCASAPARFYTLSPSGMPATASVPGTTAVDAAVAVGPVTVPAGVDRPQIVVTVGPNQVRLDEFNRWAAPLSNVIARVVAENLVRLLGTGRVSLSPQTLGGVMDYRAAVEVQNFESTLGEAASLEAVWTVTRTKDGASRTGRTVAREATPQPGYESLAAAHSRGIARLSQDIADAVRALDRPAR